MNPTYYEVRWVARGWGGEDADRARRFNTEEEALVMFQTMTEIGANVDELHVAAVTVIAGGDNL